MSGNSVVLVGGNDPVDPGRSLGTTNALLVDLRDGTSTKIPDLPKPLMFPVAGSSNGCVVVIGQYCNQITAYSEDAGLDACSPDKRMAFAIDLSKASDGWTELRVPDVSDHAASFVGARDGRILFSVYGLGKAIVVEPASGTVTVTSAPYRVPAVVAGNALPPDSAGPTFCLDGPDLIAVKVTDSGFDHENPGDGKKRTRTVWVKPVAEPDAPWRRVVKSADEATTPGFGLSAMCSEGGPLIMSWELDGTSSRFDAATGTLVSILDSPVNDGRNVSAEAVTTVDGGVAVLASNVGPRKTLYRYHSSGDRWSESAFPDLPAGFSINGDGSDKDTVVYLARGDREERRAPPYRLIVNRERG